MRTSAHHHAAFPCLLGQHKHGRVVRLDGRLYSDCFRCGIDLVRTNRRWRAAEPNELPRNWKTQRHRASVKVPRPLLVAASIALAGAAVLISLH